MHTIVNESRVRYISRSLHISGRTTRSIRPRATQRSIVLTSVLRLKILKGCLQSMVCSDWHDFTEKQVGLGVYAAGHWIDHVEHIIGAAVGEICGQEDSQELSELLYQFLDTDEVLLRWGYNLPYSSITFENATCIVRIASTLKNHSGQATVDTYAQWVGSCLDKPHLIFIPIARVITHHVLHRYCLPVPLLCILASVKAPKNHEELLTRRQY
jgi:hypothetical protein